MVFYRIFIWLYPKIAFLLGFWNQKAKAWHQGRRQIFTHLEEAFRDNKRPVIWMHCASLGEFEQGLPVLEAFKNNYPDHVFLLTFFSPSGYEVRKNYPGIDHIFYLPMDSAAHAKNFFSIVQPSLILFVKYEFWYYYLREAKNKKIPLLLVSGIFRKEQAFFSWYGNFHRKILSFFTYLFVQNQGSAALLQSIGMQNKVIVCGDTRFDRVMAIANRFQPIPVIEHFCNGNEVLVAGSTWTDDDEALDHFANTHPDFRYIIVPHEIEEERLEECLTFYKNSILYSEYEKAFYDGSLSDNEIRVLIINNVGMLSRLYHYATVSYVGGGFGDDGIHNLLEAAVYGTPIIFGPVYEKYLEATELLDVEAAFTIEDALELESVLSDLFNNIELRNRASAIAADYVKDHSGATEKVIKYVQENRLLTS